MSGKGIRRLRAVESSDPAMATVHVVAADVPEDTSEPIWQEMANEVNQLLNALAGYGLDLRDTIDPRQIRPRIEGFSACRMLIQKGICTQEEMQAMQIEAHRDLLRGILQAAENQRLQEQRQANSVVVPEKPKLVLAKH